MSSNGEFSEEQSEDLISHLKSGGPSEFEQLRSTLNLLAHVTELPPTWLPPVLPSGITQPIPLLPARSTKPRRTIVTSVIVVGMFASVSLAAAAVTGIGPAPIVNIGHQTAKFVKGVAGAVGHVVTGGNAETVQRKPTAPQIPGLTPAPTGGDNAPSENPESTDNTDNESTQVPIPAIPNALTPEAKKTSEEKGAENKDSQSKESNSKENEGSHQSKTPRPENSPTVISSPPAIPSGETENNDSEGNKTPVPSQTLSLPTALPSPNSNDDSSDDD